MIISKMDIVAKATLIENISETLSTSIFNVYKVEVKFFGYYPMFAFRVRPKNKNGVEWDIDFWFGDYVRCIKFMDLYKNFHTMEFWYARFYYNYSKENVIFNKWVIKRVLGTDYCNF